MDGVDKVWAELDGHPVLWHSVSELSPLSDSTAVVVRREFVDKARSLFSEHTQNLTVVSGGSDRQESVRRGLEVLAGVEIIAVHDAARPLASPSLVKAGLSLLDDFEGAIPVQPLDSTIKLVDLNGKVIDTVDRAMLRAAQTPQIFRADALRAAHDAAHQTGFMGTDCACLLERLGGSVVTFAGSATNFKITSRFDLELARSLIRQAAVS
jgi:2-C-methyl-D-erythritol 4-phosphate cytidylyltransferase